MSCASWPVCWASPGMRRCWPSATSARWTPCPPSWCAARCGSGWSRGQPPLPGRPAPVPGRHALAAVFPVARRPGGAGVRAAPGHHPGAEPHRVSIDSAYKRIRKAAKSAEQAVEEHKDEALHRIRKGAKRLRYVAAATGESRSRSAPRSSRRCWAITRDSVVSRAHLSQQAEAAHLAGGDTTTACSPTGGGPRGPVPRGGRRRTGRVAEERAQGPLAGRASWPVSRILFRSAGERRRGGDHPSGHTVAGCLKRPTRRLGRAALERLRSRTRCGLLALLRVGFYLAIPVTRNAGALLPHRFTLTTRTGGGFVFCGTVPRVTSDCR